jgi:hypothetical protein
MEAAITLKHIISWKIKIGTFQEKRRAHACNRISLNAIKLATPTRCANWMRSTVISLVDSEAPT